MALWRVRATVADQPGYLAVLAASLALRSVNILSVGVHVTEAGAVDDFLVDAPDELTERQVLAAVTRGRGQDVWAAPADAHSLVDAPTRALDLVTHLVRDPAAVGEALGELLDARACWQPAGGDYGASGSRMRVPAPGGGAWLVERSAPSFTPAEYARAQALLTVAAAVPRTAAAVPRTAATTSAWLVLPDGRELALRHAGAGDLAAVRAMHARCSTESIHRRYLSPEPAESRLARLLTPDHGGTLLAVMSGAFHDRVVGVANLVGEGVQAELGLLVEDAWQGRGVGTALLRRATGLATEAGFDALVVHTQAQNTAMLRTLRRLDGPRRTDTDTGVVTVTLPLARCGSPV